MAGKISSDLGSANAAVSQFKTGNSSSQHFSLGESNITGMKSAEKISNSIFKSEQVPRVIKRDKGIT